MLIKNTHEYTESLREEYYYWHDQQGNYKRSGYQVTFIRAFVTITFVTPHGDISISQCPVQTSTKKSMQQKKNYDYNLFLTNQYVVINLF